MTTASSVVVSRAMNSKPPNGLRQFGSSAQLYVRITSFVIQYGIVVDETSIFLILIQQKDVFYFYTVCVHDDLPIVSKTCENDQHSMVFATRDVALAVMLPYTFGSIVIIWGF